MEDWESIKFSIQKAASKDLGINFKRKVQKNFIIWNEVSGKVINQKEKAYHIYL
jgi:hypothetical protein